jgi:hypothetical protein
MEENAILQTLTDIATISRYRVIRQQIVNESVRKKTIDFINTKKLSETTAEKTEQESKQN